MRGGERKIPHGFYIDFELYALTNFCFLSSEKSEKFRAVLRKFMALGKPVKRITE